MKFVILSFLALVLVACDSGQGPEGEKQPVTHTPTCLTDGGTTAKLCAEDVATMTLMTADGKDTVSWADLTSVNVKVYTPGTQIPHVDLERDFTGNSAINVVAQLALHELHEGVVEASTVSGVVTVRYQRKTDPKEMSRTFTIQGQYLVVDSSFSGVTYDPGKTLDRDWLDSLP